MGERTERMKGSSVFTHPPAATETLDAFHIHVVMEEAGIVEDDLILLDGSFVGWIGFFDVPIKGQQLKG